MKNPSKTLLVLLGLSVVTALAVWGGQSDLFQGSFQPLGLKTSQTKLDKYYSYKDRVVSVVTSAVTTPVPSVITSEVVSRGGVSVVASVVVSAVASPVASPVNANDLAASRVNIKDLKILTEKTLEAFEKNVHKNNPKLLIRQADKDLEATPEKFQLNNQDKEKLLNLYKQGIPLYRGFDSIKFGSN